MVLRPTRCSPLANTPDLEFAYVDALDGVMQAADLAGFDALILLAPRFDERSIGPNNRLAIVARFGVGYDNVDVALDEIRRGADKGLYDPKVVEMLAKLMAYRSDTPRSAGEPR